MKLYYSLENLHEIRKISQKVKYQLVLFLYYYNSD